MAVVFGECGRECLSGPGNTELWSPSVYTIQLKRVLAFDKTKWRLSVVSECCWELRCCPRQPPPVTEPWLHTDCWRGFKPLVPSDKRFNHSKVWCTFISSSTYYIYSVCGTGMRLLLYERMLQYCCCCEGGDCCCMNECYNIVVAVKVATAVVWTNATILLLLWRWRLLLYERMLQYCCCCEGGDCCCMNECYNINSYWYFYFLKYNTLGLQYCIATTLLYFTTVLHLLHLLHLSISSDRCNRCNPIVLQYCCCCEGGD
jgi:hypothetical protein